MNCEEIEKILENYNANKTAVFETPQTDSAIDINNLLGDKTESINKIEYNVSKSYSKVIGYVKKQD